MPVEPFPTLRLGDRAVDVRHRVAVMGILNRTPDSFYDRGATWDFDAFVRRAEQLVVDGADVLDIGGVKAGPGPEVGENEELDRVVPAVETLRARFDVPLSVDTWRASVLDAACAAGAVIGNDISGFDDPVAVRAVRGDLARRRRRCRTGEEQHARQLPRFHRPRRCRRRTASAARRYSASSRTGAPVHARVLLRPP
ncbi:MAG: dihydropteroate synthase [Actinomycetota bacterium]|nr:dihydropteroate synthase [Actinomycetota bacterium]